MELLDLYSDSMFIWGIYRGVRYLGNLNILCIINSIDSYCMLLIVKTN